MRSAARSAYVVAMRTAGLYAIVGLLWISFSDIAVRWIVIDVSRLHLVETLKGWGFVLVTAGLLFVLIRRDLFEALRVEVELRRSEERSRLALAAGRHALYDLDVRTGQVGVNEEYCRQLGYEPGTLAETPVRWRERLHPDDRAAVAEAFEEYVSGLRDTFDLEFRERNRQGGWTWLRSLCRIVERDAQGHPVRIIGTRTDISAAKRAEERQRELTDRLIGVLESMTDGFVSLDRYWRYTYVNRRAGEMFGRTPEELIGRHIWTEFPEGVGQPFHLAYERAVAEQRPAVLEEYYAPWDRWFENRIYPTPDSLSIFFHDVTDQRTAADALRKSEARLRLALQTARIGTYDWDLRSGAVVVDDDYCRLLGFDPAETVPTAEWWAAHLHPDDRERVLAHVNDYLAGRRPDYCVEGRQGTKAGGFRWMLSMGTVVERGPSGPTRVIGTLLDIDHVKRNEIRLTRVNRALALRAELNRLVTQAETEAELLAASCRIAVETGGYRMAWVGYARMDPDRRVEPVAHAGVEAGYLRDIRITWADEPAGRGPTGLAIRTGRVQAIRDVSTDRSYERWRSAAEARGFSCSIAVPLMDGPRAFGAINLYARDPDSFDDEELALLVDLGRDLAHGVLALRARDQVRELAARQEDAREAERARIARELHDELGQALTGIKIDLAAVRERLPRADRAAGRRVAGAEALVDSTVEAVRRIAAELRPGVLDDLGLEAAIQWQVRQFGARTGIAIRVEAREDVPVFPDSTATAVFRILQESLTNVARHAQATGVVVRFGVAEGVFVIEIHDDGRGLPGDPGARPTLGLLGMRERARSHGGTLEIGPRPEGGTRVRLTLPLPPGSPPAP